MKKLLLVDDDLAYTHELRNSLIRQNYVVELAHTGKDGLQMLRNFPFDCVLLDWNLPDLTGLDVCKTYRSEGGKSPIIFLTGQQGIEEKESGLDSGGDDYLTKPFHLRELFARMRTIERRAHNFEPSLPAINGVTLDPKIRIVTNGDRKVRLSQMETEILEFLIKNRNSFFTSSQIFSVLWPSDTETSDEVVRVHIKLLRRRLSQVGADWLVQTVRGAGYIVKADPHED